jgi:penicillin-binding protein A
MNLVSRKLLSAQSLIILSILLIGLSVAAYSQQAIEPEQIKLSFLKSFHETGRFPELILINEKKYKPIYTIDEELEEKIVRLMRKYRSDFASVVAIDNNTGNILAAVDMGRNDSKPSRLTSFSPTHPAASIFKIITAADLLENTHVGNSTQFQFSGKATTLYKYQLKQEGGRWARKSDFQKAFARSNNVIFGKAALNNLSPSGLKTMAEKFGFNKDIVNFVQAKPSVFPLAADQYNLAELASGLNVSTMISPIHGAMIASVVANSGVMKKPILIKSLLDNSGNISWESPIEQELIIAPETSEDLRKMMIATVTLGTARKAFRRSSYKIRNLEIGGKTGSITGGEPFGKRDWFVAYAKDPKSPENSGISLCVMIVNKKKWYVKSSYLAREILEFVWSRPIKTSDIRRGQWKNKI